MGAITAQNGSRSRTGTLERAQSLEITETPMSAKITPKKRKAPMNETDDSAEFKEPRLSADLNANMDSLQRVRLKSAYEWGKLEDAIYDTHNGTNNADDKPEAQQDSDDESLNTTVIRQVITVADRNGGTEGIDDEHKIKQMSMVIDDKNATGTTEERISSTERISSSIVVLPEPIQNGSLTHASKQFDRFNIGWDSMERNGGVGNDLHSVAELSSSRNLDDTIKTFLEIEARNGAIEKVLSTIHTRTEQQPPSSVNISPVHFQYKSEDVYSENKDHHPDSLQMELDCEIEQIKIINYGTNMPDDVKVTRYPFGSLERPKSDVLKKLISQQLGDETMPLPVVKPTTNGVSTTTILSTDSYTMDQPISRSIISSNQIGTTNNDSVLTESNSQLSPVYSSDGQGVNSINISSMDVNICTAADVVSPTTRNDFNPSSQHENIVTISTDRSQPSSIIMIDDEKLDFTMRTLDEDTVTTSAKRFSLSPTSKSTVTTNDEVIIIESLSSKKMPETLVTTISNNMSSGATASTQSDETLTSPKTFVTEICVQTPNSNETPALSHCNVVPDELADEELISNTTPPLTPTTKMSSSIITTDHIAGENRQSMADIESHTSLPSSTAITATDSLNNEEHIPRNSEIRFTTSTYESPNRVVDKRHSSHIDQIRSAFERNHNSEIPVPVRKTSTSSLRASPSKIPVFNSTSTKVSLLPTLGANNNNSLHGSSDNLAKNNGSINRVSVSVTSIKNSSRNPSGK